MSFGPSEPSGGGFMWKRSQQMGWFRLKTMEFHHFLSLKDSDLTFFQFFSGSWGKSHSTTSWPERFVEKNNRKPMDTRKPNVFCFFDVFLMFLKRFFNNQHVLRSFKLGHFFTESNWLILLKLVETLHQHLYLDVLFIKMHGPCVTSIRDTCKDHTDNKDKRQGVTWFIIFYNSSWTPLKLRKVLM